MSRGWYRTWRLGWLEFEIEWVPKARYYVFALTWDRMPEELR